MWHTMLRSHPLVKGIPQQRLEGNRSLLDIPLTTGERLIKRIFTEGEAQYALAHAEPALHFAARAAAKEATYKALSGNQLARAVGWREIEVCLREDGAPYLRLHGRAEKRASEMGVSRVLISLTHSKAASGSPRMADCTSSLRASSRPGCVSTAGLRPPPGRRMRLPRSSRPRRSSARPRPMVLRATRVAVATAVTPPRPAARASLAVNRRRPRSSRNGAIASKRVRMPEISITPVA